MKLEPQQIYHEYQKISEYMYNRNLYEIVKINEDFYDGRQWVGVDSENMPKPVVNMLQRVVKYMIATLGSNDIAISMIPYTSVQDDFNRVEPIAKEIENVIEHAKIKEKTKIAIRNAAVDGSSYMMLSFNPDFETGQAMKGRIEAKVVDNTNVYYGNPYSNETQNQPYIIVALRQNIEQVKDEARQLGLSEDVIDQISPDNDKTLVHDDSTDLVTVLIKYFKKRTKVENVETTTDLDGNVIEVREEHEEETVWFTKCTKDVTIIESTDLGYKMYPIACFGWDPIKNSFLFNSPLTSVIPNQIFVNKCYAIAQMYGLQSAFPKIVYDKNKVNIDKFLNSTNPQAIAGIDMMGKFMDFIKVPDFSNNILALVQDIMSQTKECMGVNDASLGNVNPDNTSAIIALQESSAVPLEIQRQAFYEFWEDIVREILDIMSVTYGTREVMTDDNLKAVVNFSGLKNINYDLKIDIGNGAQYSEISQINTLDKLFQTGLINADDYISAIPQKYIPNKNKILASLRQQQQQQALMPNAVNLNENTPL